MNIHVYIHTYIYICTSLSLYIYIYIYIYTDDINPTLSGPDAPAAGALGLSEYNKIIAGAPLLSASRGADRRLRRVPIIIITIITIITIISICIVTIIIIIIIIITIIIIVIRLRRASSYNQPTLDANGGLLKSTNKPEVADEQQGSTLHDSM